MTEENGLTVQEKKPLTVQEVKAQVQLIQQVMEGVMKKNTHYGKVPGCGDKPTLLKPGAEKLMATFRLAADPQIEDLSVEDEIRYRIKVRILNYKGDFLGAGVGEASSNEKKYKWRSAVCDGEFEDTPEDRRREKWVAGWNGKPDKKVKQVRQDIADVANTVLKIAKKRSQVDAILTVTAASDIFAQDLEDMPIPEDNAGKPEIRKAQEKKGDVKKEEYDQILKDFKNMKGLIGEKEYYRVLGQHGFEHSKEIKKFTVAHKAIADMAKVGVNQTKKDQTEPA